jgi:hypothetical protein
MTRDKLKEIEEALRETVASLTTDPGIREKLLDAFDAYDDGLNIEKIVSDLEDGYEEHDHVPDEEVTLDTIENEIGEWSQDAGRILGEEIARLLTETARGIAVTVKHEELHEDNDPELAFV